MTQRENEIAKLYDSAANVGSLKVDRKLLSDAADNIAQAACRASEPTYGSDIVALASAITSAGGLKTVAELVVDVAADALKAA